MSAFFVLAFLLQLWSVSGQTAKFDECSRRTGVRLVITNVNEEIYQGHPYIQPECFSQLCGFEGSFWTRQQIAGTTNVTWIYSVTPQELEGVSECRTKFQNATAAYYQLRVVIPRSTDLLELSGDYMLLAECILTDVASLMVPIDVSSVQPTSTILQVVRNVTTDGATIDASILNATTLQIPTSPIDLGERLILRVLFTDSLQGLYTRIRIMEFVAYDPLGRGRSYKIIDEGCVSNEGQLLNADYQNPAFAIPPVTCLFDAFRFAKNPTVAFNVTVRICQTGLPQDCVFQCPTPAGRRKRAASKAPIESDQPEVALQFKAIVNLNEDGDAAPEHVLIAENKETGDLMEAPLRLFGSSEEVSIEESTEQASAVCLTYLQSFAIGGVLASTLVLGMALLVLYMCKIFAKRPTKNVDY